MTAPAPVYVRADAVLWRRGAGVVVLLPLASGEIVELTGTGSALWEALEEPAPLPRLAATLADRFGAPPAAVAADLEPALDDLVRRGALERRGSA